jgi:hypothetical protein
MDELEALESIPLHFDFVAVATRKISWLPLKAEPIPFYGEENSIECPLYPYTQQTRPKPQVFVGNTLFSLLKVLAFRGNRFNRRCP